MGEGGGGWGASGGRCGRYAVVMRPPGRWHRWGKRGCLVGAVAALGWGVVGNAGYIAASGGWSAGRSDAHRNVGVGVEGGYGGMRARCDVGLDRQIRCGALGTYGTAPRLAWLVGHLANRAMLAAEHQAAVSSMAVRANRERTCADRVSTLPHPAAVNRRLVGDPCRRERRWRRLTSNACPKCKYPLTGLKPDAPCPECGTGRAQRPRPRGPSAFLCVNLILLCAESEQSLAGHTVRNVGRLPKPRRPTAPDSPSAHLPFRIHPLDFSSPRLRVSAVKTLFSAP